MLQEYEINWEYKPGRKNVVADILSRINLDDQTFEGEKEEIVKIYHIMESRADLETIISEIKPHQKLDTKLTKLQNRLIESDEKITPYYCTHGDLSLIHI